MMTNPEVAQESSTKEPATDEKKVAEPAEPEPVFGVTEEGVFIMTIPLNNVSKIFLRGMFAEGEDEALRWCYNEARKKEAIRQSLQPVSVRERLAKAGKRILGV